MNLLVLKGFNNYFNRIIKKYDELRDYEATSSSYIYIDSINFNPGDGVRTEQILGKGQVDGFFDFEGNSGPDYLVCHDKDLNIISRWFILECDRTRGGQYKLKLKRDSIADNFNTLLTCPAYIKKGICDDDSPLILNSEGVSVNQIKSGQDFIKDKTTSAWIVGYMPKGAGKTGQEVHAQVDDASAPHITIEDLATELGVSALDLSEALTDDTEHPTSFVKDNIEIVGWMNYVDQSRKEIKLRAISQNNFASITDYAQGIVWTDNTTDCFCRDDIDNPTYHAKNISPGDTSTVHAKLAEIWKNNVNANLTTIKNNWRTYTGKPLFTRNVLDRLNELVSNETLVYKAGKYYKIRVNTVSEPGNTGWNVHAAATDVPFSTICSNTISQWNTFASNYGTWTNDVHQLCCYCYLGALPSGKVFLNYNEILSNFYLEEVANDPTVPGVSFSMSTTRKSCLDQTFDIFALPYSNVKIQKGADIYEGIGDYAQKLAVDIALNMPDTYELYDLQLLPYCPIPEITSAGIIDITNLTETEDYDWVDYTGTITHRDTANVNPIVNEYAPQEYEATATYQSTVNDADLVEWGWDAYCQETEPHAEQAFEDWVAGISTHKTVVGGKSKFEIYNQVQDPQSFEHADVTVVFWFKWTEEGSEHRSIVVYPKKSSFSRPVGSALAAKDEIKIENLCNKYRLVSPNYQGGFEFNLAKNLGYCSGFTAYCTYKPYTPYIRVVPDFNWMYGINYDKEARGLVLNGDFSLGRVNDKWTEYQLQNKNYQNIFNRDIQNLDVNQNLQRTQQYVSGGINILASGVQGGASGAMLSGGNGYAALAGAIVGAGTSGAGYAADNALMERALTEQKSFMQDKFHLQLGNIQAIPYTLTKVSAFDIDSAVFPIIEYYTCTDEEKEYLRNKFKYEGYTIGVVDTLNKYINRGNGTYVQADLIRNTEIIDDTHQLEDIYTELTKGVYI